MDRSHARVTVTPVDVAIVRPLRHEVLRPGLPVDTTRFRGDDHPRAVHVAARFHAIDADDEVIAVGTAAPDPPPWAPERGDTWRVRGMATKDGFRGQGWGRRVLDMLVAHASAHGGGYVWCHARVGALDFYRRAGFVTIGEPFDDGVAIHQAMWRDLCAS